jgi:sec-independent protein translocase protein TatB
MFDFDVGKLLLIGVVALIFIPPKDLPEALRQIGRLVGQARRIAGDFQNQFNEAIREAELTDLKDEFNQMKKTASLEGALAHVAEAIEPLESIGKAKDTPPQDAVTQEALPPQQVITPLEALPPQHAPAENAVAADPLPESKS